MALLALYLHILKVRWVQGGLRGLGAVVSRPVGISLLCDTIQA